MPTIPIPQRKVREQIISPKGVSVKRDIAAFGGATGLAEAAESVINPVTKIMQAERDKAEQTQLNELQTREMAERDRLFYDKESGYSNKQGKNAAAEFETYKGSHAKFVENELKGITSERVKEKYLQYANRAKVQLSGQMNRHAGAEMQKYEEQTAKALISQLRDSAVANYRELGLPNEKGEKTSVIVENIQKQNEAIEKLGASRGMSLEQVKEMQLSAQSETHAAVITRFLNNGEDLNGKEYFKQVKEAGQLDGDTINKLERLTKASSTKGESQRIADYVMRQNMGLGAAIEAARSAAGDDPDLRDQAVARVKNRFNENKLIQEDKDKNSFASVIDELEKTKTTEGIPIEEMEALSTKRKAAMNKFMALQAKGMEPPENPEVYQDLMLMAANPDTRSAFLRKDVNEHIHELSTASRKKFLEMQKSLKSGSSKHSKELKGFLSSTALVKSSLKSHGIKDEKKVYDFNRQLNDISIEWSRENNNRKMPQDLLQKEVDRMLLDVEVKGAWYNPADPDKKLFEVKEGETIIIPEAELDTIMKEASAMGKPMDRDKARIIYKKSLQKGI